MPRADVPTVAGPEARGPRMVVLEDAVRSCGRTDVGVKASGLMVTVA